MTQTQIADYFPPGKSLIRVTSMNTALSTAEDDCKSTESSIIQQHPTLLQKIQKVEQTVLINLTQIKDLGSGVGNADKLLRMVSSVLKILKNFQLISNLHKFDRLSFELGMTRRVFRFNRKYYLLKELKSLLYNVCYNKGHRVTPMDIFYLLFKTFILIADLNDLISYLIQLRVITRWNNSGFNKRNANFYFYECMIWLGLHLYQYYKMVTKSPNPHPQKHKHIEKQILAKQLTILKYILDAMSSHNDYSERSWTLKSTTVSTLGAISSLIGLKMVWK